MRSSVKPKDRVRMALSHERPVGAEDEVMVVGAEEDGEDGDEGGEEGDGVGGAEERLAEVELAGTGQEEVEGDGGAEAGGFRGWGRRRCWV